MARYFTIQNNTDAAIVSGDLLGQIQFASSADTDGGDSIAITAAVSVKAEGTFDASNNPAAIIFSTGPSSSPTERVKITNEGHFVPIADTSYDLGVSGSLSFRDACVSGIVFADGTYQTTAATAGGSPGGSVNQIQINDGAGGFTAATDSDRLVYDPATNILDLGRQSADDTSGTQVTNYFYSNNFAIGGNNFSSSMTNTSDFNTAIGIHGLSSLSTNSDYNIALGYAALSGLTTSSDRNIAIGYRAGGSATSSHDDSIFIGYHAGLNCLQGPNIIIGNEAAENMGNFCNDNLIIGYRAARNLTSSCNDNVIIGNLAADAIAAGFVNELVIIGYNALGSITIAPSNIVAIGANALFQLNPASQPSNMTCIGNKVAYSFNQAGSVDNTCIGTNAFNAATSGLNNVIIGEDCFNGTPGHSVDGCVLIGAGINSLLDPSSNADYNTVIGSNCLRYSTNNGYNTIIGYNVGDYLDGQRNIVIGYRADSYLSTAGMQGTGNIFIAVESLYNGGGFTTNDTQKLVIGDTLGGDLLNNRIKIGGANIVDVDTAVLEVECNLSTEVGLLVQGAASQGANLQEWQDSTQLVLTHVDATGGISGTSLTIKDYSLPLADGSANQVLTTDGAGNVTFEDAAGGGDATPSGNSTEFQYNNGGVFGGTTGVVYEATNGTGILLKVHGTGSPKDNLFSVEYTGVNTETTVSIYRNNSSDTANLFQVRTEASGDLFTVSPTGKVYERSSHGNVEHSGSASSFTFDLDSSNIFTATLSSTSSTVSIANGDVGQRFILRLTNGVANAKVGTWFSNINWPGGNPASGSLVNGETNLFGFLTYSGNGGTLYHDGFAIATGVT